MEALIRWNHKTRGLLAPGYFIPIAERTGAIIPLGHWVFEEACRQLKLWHAEGIAHISGVQFKGAWELERRIETSLNRWGINPNDLELELTRIRADGSKLRSTATRSTGCASSAQGSPSTISAPAIRR